MKAVIFIIASVLMISGCDDNQKITTCGDSIIDPGEDCDQDSFAGGQNCTDHGYNGGLLHCNADCTVDMTECTESGQCGDSVIQSDYEQCDGTNLDNETCATKGYLYGGTLRCNADCSFDYTECFSNDCGDSVREGIEECDETDLGNETCVTKGYLGGTLSCNSSCEFDYSMCIEFDICGNNYKEDQEECDGTDLGSETCLSLGFDGGTLSCKSNCEWDKSDCISPTIGEMVSVPEGTFQRDDDPLNLSTVNSFKMSTYEITRNQFFDIMDFDPSDVNAATGVTDPVQMVNWYHAITFCNKLSLSEGLTPVYDVSGVNFSTILFDQVPITRNTIWDGVVANWDADGYRLPTEMEWMWAAMGADFENPGAINTTGYLKAFAGSTGTNNVDDYGWHDNNSSFKVSPVGLKLPNEIGLYDMSGNVWEFNWDWYADYPTGSLTDYRGASTGTNRVYRGGAWSVDDESLSVFTRGYGTPDFRGNRYGFRVVRR